MYAKLNKSIRIDEAKRLLGHVVDSLKEIENVELALRVFGHTKLPKLHDCQDTKLEVPFSKDNHELLKERIKTIEPKGYTLIANSLLQAANDFPKDPGARNIIILITDGIEECGGDPCAISEALQKNGVILRPFVIGLGANPNFMDAFKCVGRYYDAGTEESFASVMHVVISQAMNNTTAQVNLIDAYGNAVESNVGMTFYNVERKKLEFSFVHTMNDRGLPDTLTLDPAIKYRLVIHTIPPVEKDNIELIAGKHNIIPVDVPQSNLQLDVKGVPPGERMQCIIRKAGESYTITEQDFNTTRRYIIGSYDLEVLSLPRIILKDISIQPYKTTLVEIPTPGKLSIISNYDVYGAIYQWNRNQLEWVCDLDVNIRRKLLTLQPSLDKPYKIIYRYKHHTRSSYTFEKDFNISSGLTTGLTL
jgi:Ca-activated chloride channel family protein